MRAFHQVGREQNRFVILKRIEGGMPVFFKVPPDQTEDFKKIAVHVTNDQFNSAARFAGADGYASLTGIPLGARVAAIGFNRSSCRYNQPAYKITRLSLSIPY
ncbi:MAG: hypothetical protein LBS22_03740 [Puniceicoccales bacterium]|jgi:hypothetical protein|nr:hypothetical protein [Puniceicoccales bacterium]